MAATGRNDANVMANIFILKLQCRSLCTLYHALSSLLFLNDPSSNTKCVDLILSHTMAPVTPGKLSRMSPGGIYFVCLARLAKRFPKQCTFFPFAFCIPVAWG